MKSEHEITITSGNRSISGKGWGVAAVTVIVVVIPVIMPIIGLRWW